MFEKAKGIFTSGEASPLYSIVHPDYRAESDEKNAEAKEQKDSAAVVVMVAQGIAGIDDSPDLLDSNLKCDAGKKIRNLVACRVRVQIHRYIQNKERMEMTSIAAKCETPVTSCRQKRETKPA